MIGDQGCFRGLAVCFIVLGFFVSANGYDGKNRVALPIPEPLDLDNDVNIVTEEELEGKTYRELEDLRSEHSKKLKELASSHKIRENRKGNLDLLAVLKPSDMRLVKTENRIRQQMFKLIGNLEGRTALSIGREFYSAQSAEGEVGDQKITGPLSPALSIVSPSTSTGSLSDALARGFLKSVGYDQISAQSNQGKPVLLGRRPFGSGYLAVEALGDLPDMETTSHGVVTFESGRVAGAIPSGIIGLEGLAVVVNKQNAVNTLTMSQVASIFSGNTTNWEKINRGADQEISVILPGKDPALRSLLHTLVMKPFEKGLGESVTTAETADHLSGVKGDAAAVSICRVSEVPSDMKALLIQSGSDSVPFAPTNENVVSLDYPLVSYLRVSTVGEATNNTEDFIKFASRSHGQEIISKAGLGSISWSDKADEAEAARHRDYLLTHKDSPKTFKTLIENATRHHTPVTFRFVPKTKDFALSDYSKTQLTQLADYMRNKGAGKSLLLLGFADNQGADSANLAYSKKRAESVAEKLKKLGIENVRAYGIGEDVPVGNNSTENGRAANRRVEVWLTE